MRLRRGWSVLVVVMAAVVLAAGCSRATPTPVFVPPTGTSTPPPPTLTPTVTATPTSTPDATATALYAGWQAELENFVRLADLGSMQGSFTPYADFEKESAQIGSYQGVPLVEAGTEFMFGAHLKWSTAIQNPELSGCGLIFGLQPNRDHYAVIVDQGRIILLMRRGAYAAEIGKRAGKGTTGFGNPAEADFQVLVRGQSAYVAVNGEVTEYALPGELDPAGRLALTVLSGTNKDYGTRCEMTGIHVWFPGDEGSANLH